MNPWLVLGPLGMVAVGISSIIYWRRMSGVGLRIFLFGGLVWAVSVAPKFLMDLTVTPVISPYMLRHLGMMGYLIFMGAFVGVRTGLFECGAAYLAFERTSLGQVSMDEATAFGVGFGAVEAIVLGLPSVVQIGMFFLNPAILDALPPAQRAYVIEQLSAPTMVVLAPIIERLFTLLVHVLSAVLVYSAVRWAQPRLLLYAFLYKSTVDAPIPYLQWALGSSPDWWTVYLVEVWVVLIGAVGYLSTVRLRQMHGAKTGYPGDGVMDEIGPDV